MFQVFFLHLERSRLSYGNHFLLLHKIPIVFDYLYNNYIAGQISFFLQHKKLAFIIKRVDGFATN